MPTGRYLTLKFNGIIMKENKKLLSFNTIRIEALSDGVFAIAITLLILEIHVPTSSPNQTLIDALLSEWESFLAFFIGFWTLLVCWNTHRFLFNRIDKSNSALSLVNGIKLLMITLTPFSTALLAKNIDTPWQHSAVNFFCLNYALLGSAMTFIWFYSKRKGFTKTESEKESRGTGHYFGFLGLMAVGVWLISYLSVLASLILFGLMFIFFGFPEKNVANHISRFK